MERIYSKDTGQAIQKITTFIQAEKESVFHHLATTEGISSWFPQLALDKKSLVFDLGDGSFEKMALLDFVTNEYIAFEWASGKIEFHLNEVNNHTQLILTESLPLDFNALIQDFTGWVIQLKNIKSVIETGQPVKINQQEIKAIQAEVKEAFQ